jgi:hypothetical protein
MAKIPLINDTHFGFKSDHPLFREYFGKFFSETFLPYLITNGFKEIIHLGDFFDRRKYVNFETLKYVRETVLEPLQSAGIICHIVLGNHDTYYKNTSSTNSLRELLGSYDNLRIYESPQDVEIDGVSLAFVPWINEGNQQQFLDFLKTSKSRVAFGHFELMGFEVLRGVKSDIGIDSKTLDRFEYVFSGHFHQKHDDGHVYYLGTQYDMTFADVYEKKGFHVLDLANDRLEYIENPNKLFHILTYDESDTESLPLFLPYAGKYVKLIVKTKKNPIYFDRYVSTLSAVNPASLTIVEESELFDGFEGMSGEIDSEQDTMSVIFTDIDNSSEIENKDRLKKLMHDLYVESFEIDSRETATPV